MVENVLISDAHVTAAIADGTMVHEMTSHSWAMVPVFALATVPVLWWRRSVVAVTGIALVVMVLHDLLFGWVTRCGAGLPLAFVLAYLGAVSLGAQAGVDLAGPDHAAHGRGPRGRRDHWLRAVRARLPDRC